MTETTTPTTTEPVRTTAERAARLRAEAAALPGPLAVAYKRRAAELELEVHLREAVALAA